MKKTILTIILSLMIIPIISLAATSTSPIKNRLDEVKQQREELRDKIKSEKENFRKERASTTQEIEKKVKEVKDEIEKRIGKKLDEKRTGIANKFEEAIKNLKALLLRVENKIAKIEERSTVATSTIELLINSKENITLAEKELTILENKLATTTSTSTKKTYLSDVKIQSDKTKEIIKATHKSIIDIIESLKPGLLKGEVKETSTSND
ncbi:MAG: hypothetical protein PHN69_01295 [Candidatus Pacebacteria bacterium]|nr:hypothetical protein [Candidatus Paceibacterota bacterium]